MIQKEIDAEIERLKALGFSQMEAEMCAAFTFCMDYQASRAEREAKEQKELCHSAE